MWRKGPPTYIMKHCGIDEIICGTSDEASQTRISHWSQIPPPQCCMHEACAPWARSHGVRTAPCSRQGNFLHEERQGLRCTELANGAGKSVVERHSKSCHWQRGGLGRKARPSALSHTQEGRERGLWRGWRELGAVTSK